MFPQSCKPTSHVMPLHAFSVTAPHEHLKPPVLKMHSRLLPLQVLPEQQSCSSFPHGEQVLLDEHTSPVPHAEPPQQVWPEPPHGAHLPLLPQMSPELQVLPAQQSAPPVPQALQAPPEHTPPGHAWPFNGVGLLRQAPEAAHESTVQGLASSQLLQALPTVPHAATVFPGMQLSPSRQPVQQVPPVHLPDVVAVLHETLFGRLM